jgi:nucleoside-diphosphate-sugar epimerase
MSGELVAVTGASGFLGSHVCDVLIAGGYQVRAGHRPTSSMRWLHDKKLERSLVNLANPASCVAFLADCHAVVHCAGALMADEDTYQRVNVDHTRILAEAAARAGTVRRFVYISSLAAGGPAGIFNPRDESMADQPISGYGRSKQAAEQLLAAGSWSFSTVTLRPPSLYGPRDRAFLPLLRWAKLGLTGRVGDQMEGLSLVEGRDAARAAVALLEAPDAHGFYYVDDGPGPGGPLDPGRRHHWGYDWDDVVMVLQTLFDRSQREINIPLGLLRTISRLLPAGKRNASPLFNPDRIDDLDTEGWVCTGARLRQDTGWKPEYNLASGMRSALAFYRRRGWI